MSLEVKGLICPQCNGKDITKGGDGLYYCASCGTKIIVHDDRMEESDSNVKEYYGRIKPSISKDDFKRAALISIALDEDTPTDIFDSKFGEVEVEEEKVLVSDVTTDVSFTVTVGTDRTEQYTVMEKKRVRYYKYANRPATQEEIRNGDYVDVDVETPVTKTRTVTDWSPFSGRLTNQSSVCATSLNLKSYITEKFAEYFNRGFMPSYTGIDVEKDLIKANNDEIAALQITEKPLNEALKLNASELQRKVASTLPGNHYKDLHCDFFNEKYTRYALLCNKYELSYKHGDGSPHVYGYSFGNSVPHNVYLNKDGKNELNGLIWKMTNKLTIITTLILLAAVFIPLAHNVKLSLAAFAFACIMYIVDMIVVKKKTEKASSDIDNIKIERLNKKLAEYGLQPYRK